MNVLLWYTDSDYSFSMELFNRFHSRLLMGFMLLDLYFICMFCRLLFVLLYFFFWPLCCLFFFDIRILITPFVSSSSSCSFVLDYKLQHSIIVLEILRYDPKLNVLEYSTSKCLQFQVHVNPIKVIPETRRVH